MLQDYLCYGEIEKQIPHFQHFQRTQHRPHRQSPFERQPRVRFKASIRGHEQQFSVPSWKIVRRVEIRNRATDQTENVNNTNLSIIAESVVLISVTRFGDISPFWQKFTSLWQILMVYFLFGKMLNLLWQICDIIGLIFIVAHGQILKNNIAIWSHWSK